jgi:hypothetical protein
LEFVVQIGTGGCLAGITGTNRSHVIIFISAENGVFVKKCYDTIFKNNFILDFKNG